MEHEPINIEDIVSNEEMAALQRELGITGKPPEGSHQETGLESLHDRIYQLLPKATETQLKAIIKILEK